MPSQLAPRCDPIRSPERLCELRRGISRARVDYRSNTSWARVRAEICSRISLAWLHSSRTKRSCSLAFLRWAGTKLHQEIRSIWGRTQIGLKDPRTCSIRDSVLKGRRIGGAFACDSTWHLSMIAGVHEREMFENIVVGCQRWSWRKRLEHCAQGTYLKKLKEKEENENPIYKATPSCAVVLHVIVSLHYTHEHMSKTIDKSLLISI